VKEDAASEFEDGTRMKELADSGAVKIGVKYDQPGLGFKDAASDIPTGFDVEMAKVLAADLGIAEDKVEWVETISDNREPFLQDGTVDLVLASYSITEERRAVVGQAGPYLVTGQQLLVAADSDIESVTDVKGEEVCSVTGSTSLETIEAEGAKPVGFDTYSECVEKVLDGTVEAMTTDGTILAGYAAQNEGELKVVGEEFSEENIGVGLLAGLPEMCQWIVDTITEALRGRDLRGGLHGHARPVGRRGAGAPRDGLLRVLIDPCPASGPAVNGGPGPPARRVREEWRASRPRELSTCPQGLRLHDPAVPGLGSDLPRPRHPAGARFGSARGRPARPSPHLRHRRPQHPARHHLPVLPARSRQDLRLAAFGWVDIHSARSTSPPSSPRGGGVEPLHIGLRLRVAPLGASTPSGLGPGRGRPRIGFPSAGVMSQVVLPQAFRASVPPLASTLIALLKNTSVAGVFGVLEAAGA
jgi:glutamate transport system substrate-binding protein